MKKLFIGGLVAVPVLAALKKRHMLHHLSGMTEAEAREAIVTRATPRVGAEKAEHIADCMVARLAHHGRLATDTVAV